MSKYTDNPNGFTHVESLYQLHLYKLHNSDVGDVNQSLDDYVRAERLISE